MTDQPGAASQASAAAAPLAAAPVLVTADACPFLIAAAGAYRMSIPDREHRCSAFVPATSLALTKQGRLCLTTNHVGCATYIASTSARQARVGSGERVERVSARAVRDRRRARVADVHHGAGYRLAREGAYLAGESRRADQRELCTR